MQRQHDLMWNINDGFNSIGAMMKKANKLFLGSVMLVLVFGGCAVIDHSRGPVLEKHESWVLLPMLNHTSTPQAGRRAEAITEALLYNQGIQNLRRYPSTLQEETFLVGTDHKLLDKAVQWAKTENVRYGLTGTVDEWRYKVGIDGEPAVGISLKLLDLNTNQVVWSAVGGQSGWSREAVSAVAQKLIKRLLEEATFS